MKKNMAKPMIPPRLLIDDSTVEMRILIAGIVLRSFSGLRNLTDLRALREDAPVLPSIKMAKRSLKREARTTKKSSQFQLSLKYECWPVSPMAMTLKRNSKYMKKLKKGSETLMTLLIKVLFSLSV